MYVHRALSCHCRHHVWILTLLLSRRLHPLLQDSRAQSRKDPQKSKKTRLPSNSCLNKSVRAHASWPCKSVCSLCHHAFMGSNVLAKWSGQSVFTKFRAAPCSCFAPCPCFASCSCCHDPFIVRSAQTCPPFTGFTQLAHPSRCPRSTLTTVCFCARVSVFTSGLCVYIVAAALHQIHHRLVAFIL